MSEDKGENMHPFPDRRWDFILSGARFYFQLMVFMCWSRISEISFSLFTCCLPIHQSFLEASTIPTSSKCSVFSYNILSDLKVMIVSTLTLIFASKPFKRSICLCSKSRLCYCFSETFASQRSVSLQGLSLVWQVLNVEQPGV